MRLDLNCDLGEGEPISRTRALMDRITSANVACGGHAGDVTTMTRCLELARTRQVRVGAHPGPWSRQDFGRADVSITPDELELLLLHQIGALEEIGRTTRVRLHHVKLHGALYHATDASPPLARRYLDVIHRRWPGLIVFARAGGRVAQMASEIGVRVWPEVFADRGYQADGTLIPRGQPAALLDTVKDVRVRIRTLLAQGWIASTVGSRIALTARTVCVHADTPTSVVIAGAVATEIRKHGF